MEKYAKLRYININQFAQFSIKFKNRFKKLTLKEG